MKAGNGCKTLVTLAVFENAAFLGGTSGSIRQIYFGLLKATSNAMLRRAFARDHLFYVSTISI